jgi:hypothetical protein
MILGVWEDWEAALAEAAQQPATANPSCWYISIVLLKQPSLLKSSMARRSSILEYPCRFSACVPHCVTKFCLPLTEIKLKIYFPSFYFGGQESIDRFIRPFLIFQRKTPFLLTLVICFFMLNILTFII